MPSDEGTKIECRAGELVVPNDPIIPFIVGDGTGTDIWAAAQPVFDAAVAKAYGGERRIAWQQVLAGDAAQADSGEWLPDSTVEAFRTYLVGIKGPLTTPVGSGIRSLNVALRQMLDLYVCLRPVRYFPGVPSPAKRPELVNMVIYRENAEDIYAGIEFEADSDDLQRFMTLFREAFPDRWKKIRFPETSGIGIKPISKEGTKRLVRAAIKHAINNNSPSVTLVHKGNIMKFTEGAFRDWGYELACEEFGATVIGEGPWCEFENPNSGGKIVIKDAIADAFLQQIQTRGNEFSVIATMNLNGDYLSDALAAQVGGIGIAPGGNINYDTGHALFEATHGTAPKYTGQDKVNPGSLILSGEMMLRYLGWTEAAALIIKGIGGAIAAKTVTYDFERLMEGATLVPCSGFGTAIIEHM